MVTKKLITPHKKIVMEQKQLNKVIGSCFLAICIEMYDFSIFAFLSHVIQKNYLNFMAKDSAQFMTYLFFGVSFVFRPIGSLIFGYIGDKYGRKKALILSISLMGFSSLAMALLPPYEMIGILSFYLIGLIRILQGISVGGEYSGALIYAVEQYNPKKIGVIGGVVVCGSVCGTLLAILSTMLFQSTWLPSYSWRFSFLLGFSLSFLGFYIRKKLSETPEFQKFQNVKKKATRLPLFKGFSENRMECISTIFISGANGVNFYFILVFMPNFANKLLGGNLPYLPIITTSLLIVFGLLFSYISDFVGRKKLISFGLIFVSGFNFIGILLFSHFPSLFNAILFFCLHAIVFSITSSIINIYVIEIFPASVRYSCSSFFYSIGVGFIGGTSPLVCSLFMNTINNPTIYVCIYVSLTSIVGYICLKLMGTYSNMEAPFQVK